MQPSQPVQCTPRSPWAAPPTGVVDLWLRWVQPRTGAESGAERLLTPDELERARRFASADMRALFMLGRSLLRAALSTYLGCAPQDLRLDQRCDRCGEQHGKPRLVDPGAVSDLAFNLSHAQGLVALAVCRNDVGIDVEWRGSAETMPEVAPLLLSAAEFEALEEIPAARRSQMLLECWVRKEALLKATGEGLGRDPREVVLPLPRDEPAVYWYDGAWWSVRGLDVGPDHAGAVAVRESIASVRHRSFPAPLLSRS